MEVDEGKEVKESNEKTEKVFLAEIEVYFSLLCLMFLLDQNKVEQVRFLLSFFFFFLNLFIHFISFHFIFF